MQKINSMDYTQPCRAAIATRAIATDLEGDTFLLQARDFAWQQLIDEFVVSVFRVADSADTTRRLLDQSYMI